MALQTFSEVVNEVLNFGFNDGPQVNRERIKNWVNDAQAEIARQVNAPEFQETQTIQLQTGVYQYPLPTDFLRAQDLYYPALVMRLRPVDVQDIDLANPQEIQGAPEIYALYQSLLLVAPAASSNTDTLQLRYIKQPPTLTTDSDVPLLNAVYLHLLVKYATAEAFTAEDDFEAAQFHRGRYEKDLAKYATDEQDRIADRPRILDGTWGAR